MKDRGKAVETFNGEACFQESFSTSSDMPCRKHPSSSSSSSSSSGGGICAFCLRERLFELVCPECGEQRLSSCSCSENSSDPNSNPEIGGVGRISFLLENEKAELPKNHPKSVVGRKTGEPEILKRSNSSCVADVNSRGGFWKLGRLFRKRRQKNEGGADDSKSEMWVSDLVGIPRSRSLCSFRGGVNGGGGGGNSLFYDTEIHSAARVSSVSGGFMMDSAKRSCFSESEARISNFDGRISNFDYEKDLIAKGIFSCSEDPKFIDLKLDLSSSLSSSEIRTEHPVLRRGGLSATKEFGYGGMRSNEYYGMLKNGGGSCRFSVSERDLKKCRKSRKVQVPVTFYYKASKRKRRSSDLDVARQLTCSGSPTFRSHKTPC